MDCFSKILNGWKLLFIIAKRSILDVWQGSEYISANRGVFMTFSNMNEGTFQWK